ncbi:MAG: hypothetical protein KY392_05525, partial [Chloroflexi bacterium]|nr:hypothetical protein [Chloroflexota bacterium]
PNLRGYVGTTAKPTAAVALVSEGGDPLLAQWQYGLGRAAAWTSDAREQWAAPWIGTPDFGTLTAQLVAWTLPPQDTEGIDVRFSPGERGELDVEVTSVDEERGPRNFYRTVLRLVSPDLEPTQTVLEQVGPGRYAGSVLAEDPGAYLVRVAQTYEDGSTTDAASRTLGMVSPAADEFRRLGIDTVSLAAFADAGEGRELSLDDERSTGAVWAHDIRASAFPTPIWPWLLVLAMLLVPLDVGVRRVALSRADLRRARDWTARRLGMGHAAPEAVPGLAELRAARDRSARRGERADRRPAAEASASETHAVPSATAAGPAAATPTARTRSPVPSESSPPASPSTSPPVGETLAERLARRRREGRG